MADVFRFYVYDDRSIQFNLAEPIMLEDKNVTQFVFRIPKSINGFDMTTWSWWFVYVNALHHKYSVPLVFTDDEDEPDEYANATYTVDYGMSGTAGTISFALEAINADATTSEILNEWHTYTYTTRVISTLQGNQAEFEQSEIDVIAGMIQDMLAQVREMIEESGIGGTSDDIENASSVSGSTVSDALNSLSDEIANETTARQTAISAITHRTASTPTATVLLGTDTSGNLSDIVVQSGEYGTMTVDANGNATFEMLDLSTLAGLVGGTA